MILPDDSDAPSRDSEQPLASLDSDHEPGLDSDLVTPLESAALESADPDIPLAEPSELPELVEFGSNQALSQLGIQFFAVDGRLVLQLPPEAGGDWQTLWQQLQINLQARPRFWPPQAPLELQAGSRLLDQQQLQQLAETCHPLDIHLQRVCTSRRQTAIAAATLGYSVEQTAALPLSHSAEADPGLGKPPLVLETTLRSGVEICHPGPVILIGDLNPGSAIIAAGDILVWGRIRGIVHAGAEGNTQARIMGLYLAATQLRIADLVARTPEPPQDFYPEVAHATPQGIRITPASEFVRQP